METYTQEQFEAVIKHLDAIRICLVSKEDYERAAIIRDDIKQIRMWSIGYESQEAFYIMFKLLNDEGVPVDAEYDTMRDVFLVVFQFKDMYYEIEIEDWVHYEDIRKKIHDNKSKL